MRAKKVLPPGEEDKIDLSAFDESDPEEHLMKIFLGNGLFAGLRGSSEHVSLLVAQIVSGIYSPSHPFQGMTWAGLDLKNRKANKLRPTNVYFSENAEINRQPVWDSDPSSSCWAGSLLRFRDKIGPNQKRVYCYPASDADKALYEKQGCPRAAYNPNRPMGKNCLAKLLKAAAKKLGFSEPDEITGHMLRRMAVTTLVNNPNVNLSESMELAGHKSVSAHLAYIEKDSVSEVERV